MSTTTSCEESLLQTRPVAIADIMRIKNVIDVQMSPDGEKVAWVVGGS